MVHKKDYRKVITRREDDYGVVPQAGFLQRPGEVTDCFVHTFHHAGVGPPPPVSNVVEVFRVPRRDLKRIVDSLEGVVEEQWLQFYRA